MASVRCSQGWLFDGTSAGTTLPVRHLSYFSAELDMPVFTIKESTIFAALLFRNPTIDDHHASVGIGSEICVVSDGHHATVLALRQLSK